MKILFVITSLRIGGAENLVSEIVPRLIMRNNSVDVLLFDGEESQFKCKLESKGVSVFSLGSGKNVYDVRNIFRLRSILKKYDIVHTHNTACQMYTAIAKCLFRANCKLVTTEHNTDNRRRHIFFFKIIDKWMYRQYGTIISISEKATVLLKEYIGNQFLITTIANGVDLEKYKNAVPIYTMRSESEVIITMVAAFRPQKDQETIIKALSLLPAHYHLWLVGDGERRNFCEQLTVSLGIKNKVSFLGIRNDIPEILASSDIIVMSTHYEGMSLSNIEGMSVGKPFIASDVNGIREITGGAGLLFKEGDANQLSKTILNLMNNKDLYDSVAKKCLSRAEMFNISKTVEGYLKVYDGLAHT